MTVPWHRLRQVGVTVPIVVPLVVLLVFVARGCETASVPLVHPPPGVSLPATSATTVPVDLRGVQLAGADGTTTLVPPASTGTAHLSGSVNGPQGPVPGAVVRVEHLVAGKPPATDLTTDATGHWDLPGIAGGRYRLRGFLAPSLAQTEPDIFFLSDGEQQTHDLTVEQFSGLALAASVAPDPPQLNQPLNLVVRVARKSVDSRGVVQSNPVVNASVTLTAAPGWSVNGSSSAVTNGAGDAAFSLQCRSAGANQIQVAARPLPSDQPQPSTLEVSACFDPRSTSTTATTPSSGGPSSTTTSTPPGPN
jgi:hypothetical protein